MTASQAFQAALEQHQAGLLQEAEASYRQALALNPDYAEALNNLGNVLVALGRLSEAEAKYRRTLQLRPDAAVIHANLGKVLAGLGRHEEAERSVRQALDLQPGYAEAHNDLGKLLQQRGLLEEAERCYLNACALKPDLAAAHFNAGNLYFNSGRIDEAERSYRRALALDPGHAETRDNLVYLLNYIPGKRPTEIYSEYRELARRFYPDARPASYRNDRDPGRRIRVGYVSGDLRDHAVSFFIEPVLAAHDHRQFEVFCYYNHPTSDGVTQRLKTYPDHWRDVINLDDRQFVELVQADAIDILVDLSGHTVFHRLSAFRFKPAPIQATWLAFNNTTGLSTIDYRITDARSTPEGVLDSCHSEKLIRLPGMQYCYRPWIESPAVEPLPCQSTGTVTFGAFTSPFKIGVPTVKLWGQLLARVPGSRLLISYGIPGPLSMEYRKRFTDHGIAAERLEVLGAVPRRDYMSLRNAVDIALDTFPCNGGTTTCESLWMGVPVVSLAGETTTSRGGAGLLHAIGLGNLVAENAAQYIDLAATLAADIPRLAALRTGMRARMKASPLMDETGFTMNLENAYREMWRRWCEPR